MADLQKLNLDQTSKQIGSKVSQTVAPAVAQVSQTLTPHIEAAGKTVNTAMEATMMPQKHFPVKAVLLVVIIAAGLLSGFGLNKVTGGDRTSAKGSTRGGVQTTAGGGLKVGDIVGLSESDGQFSDTAEGVLDRGGLNGEGSHKLLRPGGDSQTAYLTSSVIDLDQFAGHRVKVWGETFAGQKVGWLMDVGRVQVLELNAPTPEGN